LSIREFPGVQWLEFSAFIAVTQGSIPDQGTTIPRAAWHGQKIKKKTTEKKRRRRRKKLRLRKVKIHLRPPKLLSEKAGVRYRSYLS
jgi:hypothetical protein